MEAGPRTRGAGRILYWFRTPPGIRVGRAALDDETRRLLERQHPEIAFDWRHLLAGSQPPLTGAPRPRPAPSTREHGGGRRPRDRRLTEGRVPHAPAGPPPGTGPEPAPDEAVSGLDPAAETARPPEGFLPIDS